jgi:hypothetical protein
MADPKPAAPPTLAVNPLQVIAIVSAILAAASQVVPKLIGKTGDELRDAIIESVPDLVPTVETITGKDLVNDAKFRAAMIALAESINDAPPK